MAVSAVIYIYSQQYIYIYIYIYILVISAVRLGRGMEAVHVPQSVACVRREEGRALRGCDALLF